METDILARNKGALTLALTLALGLGLDHEAHGDVLPAFSAEQVDFFENEVRPILAARCLSCHSRAAKKSRGGLLLDTRESTLRGGASGPALVPGDANTSALIQAIRYTDADLEMPPDEKLPDAEIDVLTKWVAMGAPDPRAEGDARQPARIVDLEAARAHWAFQPISTAQPPAASSSESPIDGFIDAKLREQKLKAVGPADPLVWIRRVTLDLTGLPPTPDQTEAFVRDRSADAHARVIERLLSSPRYGERWGRHWLDLVRYADTAGCSSDFPVPQARHYRDYVIQAFNDDKPYDHFLREQLAGDLMPATDDRQRRGQVVATGYLALSRRFGIDLEKFHHLTIADTVDNVGRTMLGLGLGCAKCHAHKFDPIPQEDFFALYGIFESTVYPFTGSEKRTFQKDFVPLASASVMQNQVMPYLARLDEIEMAVTRLEGELKAAQGPRTEALTNRMKSMKKERKDVALTARPNVEWAYATRDGQGADARVHIKGEPEKLGRVVPRGFLTVLGGQTLPADFDGSGRSQLADWMVDPENPLTARVMVNRIWQHHFGHGLVSTPNDFGARGVPPTHPELLDFLAHRFVASGWSIKAMHRLILGSSAYRRAAHGRPENAKADPVNRWLWRFSRQRLEPEAIRDAVLAVSGQLDLQPGDGHAFAPETEWDYSQAQPFTADFSAFEHNKRSVYWMSQRLRKRSFLEVFDGADPNFGVDQRPVTTTPLQSLYFMNAPFVHEQAQHLALRLATEAATVRGRVDRAYRLVLGRPPTSSELRDDVNHLDAWKRAQKNAGGGHDDVDLVALASLARVLLASNEFLFIE